MKTQTSNADTFDYNSIPEIKAYIKETYDLRDLYPKVKRRNYPTYSVDLCVFHSDHKPSMLIYKDGYLCRGCLEQGDIISFVMKTQGMDFITACTHLQHGFDSLHVVHRQSYVVPPDPPKYSYEPDAFHNAMLDTDYDELLAKTGIERETAVGHKIGKFGEGVFSIPIQHPLRHDTIVDLKLYRPKAARGEIKTWHYKDGAHNYLYGIHFVKSDSPFVVIKGGEKDTILGHQLKLPFVTATSGEGSWDSTFNSHLSRFSEVFCWLDADESGQLGTMNIKRHLPRVILCDWRTLYDPKVKSGFDFADYYQEGGTADLFLEMLSNARKGIFSGRVKPILS